MQFGIRAMDLKDVLDTSVGELFNEDAESPIAIVTFPETLFIEKGKGF